MALLILLEVSDRMKWFLIIIIIIIMILLVRKNKLEHAAYENKLIKETRKLRAAKMAAGREGPR